MSLRDRLEDVKNDAVLEPQGSKIDGLMGNKVYQELRSRIHRKLLDRVDLSMMENMAPELLTTELKVLVERLLTEEAVAINDIERMNLVRDIQHEVLGLGPLEILMADPTISDILVNTYNQIYIERRGKLELTDVRFESEAHLLKIIDKIVSGVGRRVDESSPMVDARLPDGSRVNAIIPPLAVDGAILSIRRFAITPLGMKDLLHNKSLTPEMAEVLEGLVKAKVNIIEYNPIDAGEFQQTLPERLNLFTNYLETKGIIVNVRRSRGKDIDAACGQLANKNKAALESSQHQK